jgi:hypothetical protein
LALAKITIPDVAAGFSLQTDVNTRLQQIEDELNNKVLYRANPVGESNAITNDIDMGNKDLYNVKSLVASEILVNGVSIDGNFAASLAINSLYNADGSLRVSATSTGSTLSGVVELESDLNVAGNQEVTGTLDVTGAVGLASTLSVTGTVSSDTLKTSAVRATDDVFFTGLGTDGILRANTAAGVRTALGVSAAPVNRVLVTVAADLAGTLDSTKEYFLDGIVDMGSQSIEVPTGGLAINGYSTKVSKLISTEASYTLFTSPAGGSGDVNLRDTEIKITGTGSQVYNLVADTSAETIETVRITYQDCSSLGTVDNYSQILETSTIRDGGKPEFTLAGAWSGGYKIVTSVVRNLVNADYSVFKAGAAFVMASRFVTDMNIDLPALANFADFAQANFTIPSALQLTNCQFTRDGVQDGTDTNILPNITAAALASAWHDNVGLPDTYEGGQATLTTEAATTTDVDGVYKDLLGTYTFSDLAHFDSSGQGQLRNIGVSPQEYQVKGQFIIASTLAAVVGIRLAIWDDSASTYSYTLPQYRTINNQIGGVDVAYFTYFANISLNKDDFVKVEAARIGSTGTLTAKNDSFFVVEER